MEKEASKSKKATCSIDKKFIPYKIHYFLLCSAHVGVVPYLPVFAKTSLGLSATAVGLLSTCMQFSTTLSKPLFGMLADYFNRVKAIIVFLIVLEVILNLSMLGFPIIREPSLDANHTYADVETHVQPLLKMSPARIYDASAAVHVDHRWSKMNSQTNQQAKEHISNSFKRSFRSNPKRSLYTLKKRFQRKHQLKDEADSKLKCSLHCETAIHNISCYLNTVKCLDSSAINNLQCDLNSNIHINSCNNFNDDGNFKLTYKLKRSKNSTSKQLKMHPRTIVRQVSLKPDQSGACNISSIDCSLRCEHGINMCNFKKVYDLYSLQFWLFAICAILSAMCQGSLFTLSDTACHNCLHGSTANFGRQRLWGAIGWGATAPLTGFLNDLASQDLEHDDYTPGFYTMVVLSAFFLLTVLSTEFKPQPESVTKSVSLKRVLRSKDFILMEISVFLCGILTAFTSNYVLWFLESLGSSRVLMGMTLAVECLLGEAPFMFFSERIIEKLGHWNVVTLTFVAFTARFSGYYFLQNVWLVLPIELLNGITYGLFYTTMTSYANMISPAANEATMQGIYGGTFQGLGTGIGSLVAGIAFDKYGGRLSFLMAAIFSACAALINAIMCLCNSHSEPTFHKLP